MMYSRTSPASFVSKNFTPTKTSLTNRRLHINSLTQEGKVSYAFRLNHSLINCCEYTAAHLDVGLNWGKKRKYLYLHGCTQLNISNMNDKKLL